MTNKESKCEVMSMTKRQRSYSKQTLKILFALSGNQCAHPKCTNNVVEPATDSSDSAVMAQICHIYALSVDGPRGKTGLTSKESNSPENLILLCPNHHTVVDKQFETYPAEKLKQWKQNHEDKVKNWDPTSLGIMTKLIDQEIQNETGIIRQSRFFVEFDSSRFLDLARKLVGGEFSIGSDAARSESLAWCVRFLSCTEELDEAEKYFKYAKKLGTCPELDIADAFISSQKDDRQAALSTLAEIDSPLSRSAAFMIVKHHGSPQEAINWLKTADVDASSLDPDGKYRLLACQLELSDWEAALKSIDVLTRDDLCDVPALHYMIAITRLLSIVPKEFRSVVLNQIPLQAAHFPLASDATSIENQRIARQHFIEATKVARQLNLPRAAKATDEYALWLELRDPDESDNGRKRLESKLRDPKSALPFIRLGIEFGTALDLAAIEREIERQIALNGGVTLDAALARFALTFTQKTPEDAANYIVQHCDELTGHINKQMMLSLQIDLFSQAGRLEKANECLDILLKEGLSEAEESRLRGIIAEAEGVDSTEVLKGQFKRTDSLRDLANLVNKLGDKGDWENLCEYSEILFGRTGSLHDAEVFAFALHKTQKSERLIGFLESNKTIVARSDKLKILYCWSLYFEGKLLEARSELKKLDDDWDNEEYRRLQVYLAISLGDWNFLSRFVAKECSEKDKRNAQELIWAAQLALHLDSIFPAKELIRAAINKGKDDASILGTAYILATNAGWEDQEVSQWINRAVTLSDEDGPFQKMTLKDMVDQKPEWDRRESEIWQMLNRGETPMFIAAHHLNKSLIDLVLFPALANLSESDPRRRGIIPAYSGQRQPLSLDTSKQIGMDVTVLLTLSFLDILDEALDAFDKVHIPHSTLNWLLDEKQRVAFHQPSRIKDAHHIRGLLATGALEKFSPSTGLDSELSEQVGEELARFISEAEKCRGEDDSQHIVVRPSPVHRVSSLMEEEADLTAHVAVLSSCQSIVAKLRQKGRVTASEADKAQAYLRFQEKPWPNQPEIADRAILYLDDLSVDYFLHLGILEKLQAAGFRPIVSLTKISETNQLISYESISSKVRDAIEHIQSAINSRIESKKIKVGGLVNADQSSEQQIYKHPTATLFHSTRYCDSIITDDRFFNQHANFDDVGTPKPVFLTLDIIDTLVSTGAKTAEKRLAYRTRLRQAGYILVPVGEDELAHHLAASTVEGNKVIETAELKAIRENILCVRMRNWLQLPKETPWLDTLLMEFIRSIKSLWRADADFSGAKARSDWLVSQIDIRGWSHSFGKEISDNTAKTGRSGHLLLLFTPPGDVPREVRDEYWNWVQERILAPIKKQDPDLYSWIIEMERELIEEIANTDITEREET